MIREASTWILQADQMVRPKWYSSAQMQALNPALVMFLIPFNNLVLYPALRRGGVDVRPLRRMGFGFASRVSRRSRPAPSSSQSTAAMQFQSPGRCCLCAVDFGEALVSLGDGTRVRVQLGAALQGVIMAFWRRYPIQDHFRDSGEWGWSLSTIRSQRVLAVVSSRSTLAYCCQII